ncbi:MULTISPECIES: Rossmann-like and DUF2520 domain-containing protein [unclassified Acinetobacter]|uniref:Rossmann-like and DUF2520 domain-containing protein n=1 Tax=unclassified Acinetobacter TaxID=196816 RepID=UPI002934B2AF|nr:MULTISPECIES: DUF2520 domain-containing protein [unclassified Acinetobacter]WOE31699.1 DUF2520 domain-containing protein [Acinetobacter sp. SAAs470]WOE37165.1 DUF2520 domain-containing protein [Acinetobacter sp. SAAs474]
MKIGLIGSGRVATHLACKLQQQHQIMQVYSRDKVHAEHLAIQVQAMPIDDLKQFDLALELLIICVSDSAIVHIAEQLAQCQINALVVHTSGSTSLDALSNLARHGVFYPLQTFSLDSPVDWGNTPLLIEARHTEDHLLLTQLAQQLSTRVYAYSSEQRLSLHLAAVFACNFTNYCYDMAQQVVAQHQVDFALLHPLILTTAQKVTQMDAKTAQTGPAVRADQHILAMHQALLANSAMADFGQIYQLMSQAIVQRHKPDHNPMPRIAATDVDHMAK